MSEAKTGRIVTFSSEQGFGRVRLDDGTEMPFDVGAATAVPVVGEVVRVTIGVGRLGRPKVVALASLADAEESDDDVSFGDALAALRAEGLGHELSDKRAASLAAELFGDDAGDDLDATDLLDVLAAYYGDGAKGAARAQRDKWLAHDWRFGQETDDVVAEFAALVGGEPLLVQVSNDSSTLTLRERSGATRAIDFSAKSNSSLATIAELWNDRLARAGDRRRFYSLDTGGDWFAFYLLEPDRAERLRRALPFDDDVTAADA